MAVQDRKYMEPTEEQAKQADLFPERAQEARIAELERENADLRQRLDDAEKPLKAERKKLTEAKGEIRELKELLDHQREVICDQADKLQSPADVKPLCDAICILMAAVKLSTPEGDNEYRELHRQFLCDALNAADRLYRDVFCGVPCVPEWLFGNPQLPRLWKEFKGAEGVGEPELREMPLTEKGRT